MDLIQRLKEKHKANPPDDWEILEPFWHVNPMYGAARRISGKWYGYIKDIPVTVAMNSLEEVKRHLEDLRNGV